MKILAVIITYFPDVDTLKSNVSAFIEHVDKVLIWENTPDNKAESLRIPVNDKISYVGSQVNEGIAAGLNYAWHYAKENNYDLLLTMDQDSQFEDFYRYKEDAIAKLSQELAIFSPTVNNEALYYPNQKYILRPYAITSGMLVPIELIERVGGYRTDFFVDAIDIAFSAAVTELGVPIYKVSSTKLNQCYGNPQFRVFFGKKFYGVNYSLFRYEGIYRNHIILARQYPHNKELKKLVKSYYIRHLKGILIVEHNKLAKLWAIFKGTYKGLTYNL